MLSLYIPQVIPNIVWSGHTAFSMSQAMLFTDFIRGLKKPSNAKRAPPAPPTEMTDRERRQYYVRLFPWARTVMGWGTDFDVGENEEEAATG